MKVLENKNMITSLEILEQINIFRKQEGNRTELQHNDLLKIIRDEFEEEIHEGKISQMFYDLKIGNGATRKSPMFKLTIPQGKQILVRESKFVRKAVIHYLEELENRLKLSEPVMENQNMEIMDRYSRVKIAETLKSLIPLTKSETYKDILVAESAKVLTGKELLPPVQMPERTLTAKEIADILGINANRVGKISNKYNLKTEENGCWVHDKAKYCNKEVPSFRYYEKAIDEFKKYI